MYSWCNVVNGRFFNLFHSAVLFSEPTVIPHTNESGVRFYMYGSAALVQARGYCIADLRSKAVDTGERYRGLRGAHLTPSLIGPHGPLPTHLDTVYMACSRADRILILWSAFPPA